MRSAFFLALGRATDLVTGHRVKEGGYSCVEETQEPGEVDDECATEGFDVVLLQDM